MLESHAEETRADVNPHGSLFVHGGRQGTDHMKGAVFIVYTYGCLILTAKVASLSDPPSYVKGNFALTDIPY